MGVARLLLSLHSLLRFKFARWEEVNREQNKKVIPAPLLPEECVIGRLMGRSAVKTPSTSGTYKDLMSFFGWLDLVVVVYNLNHCAAC